MLLRHNDEPEHRAVNRTDDILAEVLGRLAALEAKNETVEVRSLVAGQYRTAGVFRTGDTIRSAVLSRGPRARSRTRP